MLKCEKILLIKVEYSDLEQYIDSIYGVDPDIPLMEEWRNEGIHELTVRKHTFEQWERECLETFKLGEVESTFALNTILGDMANSGHIQEGEYLINICW